MATPYDPLVSDPQTRRRLPPELRFDSIGQVLARAAQREGCFQSMLDPAQRWSHRELIARARVVAVNLRRRGVGRGDVVGLLLPNSLDLVAGAFGVFLSGAALAPLALPSAVSQLATAMERLRRIVADGGIQRVIARADFAGAVRAAGIDVAVLPPEDLLAGEPKEHDVAVGGDDLALVQYTSGSTSHPKGVALTHRQVAAGVAAIVHGAGITADDNLCTWLPMFHDMGFIALLVSAMSGAGLSFTPPSAFVKRPLQWLRAFEQLRGTLYPGPNFSFQYLIDAVGEAERSTLDLRRWRVAFNGAERIDPALVERFARWFEPAGLPATTMFPVYGLAEATLAVTFPDLGTVASAQWVDRVQLANARVAVPVARGHELARGVQCVGRPVAGVELRIVARGDAAADANGAVLPERRVGEIEVRGASVTRGFHRAPQQTAAGIRDGWVATGDLGYLANGQLFVTGRCKELMKLRGECWFPEDVEPLVRELAGVHRGRCVAVVRECSAADRMAILIETQHTSPADLEQLGARARQAIAGRLEEDAFEVHLLTAGTIEMTTSGKYQRLRMRERLEAGALAADTKSIC